MYVVSVGSYCWIITTCTIIYSLNDLSNYIMNIQTKFSSLWPLKQIASKNASFFCNEIHFIHQSILHRCCPAKTISSKFSFIPYLMCKGGCAHKCPPKTSLWLLYYENKPIHWPSSSHSSSRVHKSSSNATVHHKRVAIERDPLTSCGPPAKRRATHATRKWKGPPLSGQHLVHAASPVPPSTPTISS